jgi:hypothetical protein
MWERSDKRCLLRVIGNCLKFAEKKCEAMSDDQMEKYILKCEFLLDAFRSVPLFDLFFDK